MNESFQVFPTALPGVLLIEPQVHGDHRGFFLETYHQERYVAHGIPLPFVQDNHSRSTRRGVLRGLHAQLCFPQGKLVRAVEGAIFDVAVDIRVGSPTFGKATWAELSAENFRQLYVPPGFAHGFLVTSEAAQVEYKCTALYRPTDEISLRWDDPALAIPWPLDGLTPTLAGKDADAPTLAELTPRLPRYPHTAVPTAP